MAAAAATYITIYGIINSGLLYIYICSNGSPRPLPDTTTASMEKQLYWLIMGIILPQSRKLLFEALVLNETRAIKAGTERCVYCNIPITP